VCGMVPQFFLLVVDLRYVLEMVYIRCVYGNVYHFDVCALVGCVSYLRVSVC